MQPVIGCIFFTLKQQIDIVFPHSLPTVVIMPKLSQLINTFATAFNSTFLHHNINTGEQSIVPDKVRPV